MPNRLGPGLNMGVIRGVAVVLTGKSRRLPSCQQAKMAFQRLDVFACAPPGAELDTEAVLDMRFTWEPIPSRKRPLLNVCRSPGTVGQVVGLRGKATAMPVAISSCGACSLASASGRKDPSCLQCIHRRSRWRRGGRLGRGGQIAHRTGRQFSCRFLVPGITRKKATGTGGTVTQRPAATNRRLPGVATMSRRFRK